MSVADPRARVVVLAGPSGAGKSRLAERLHTTHGWPIVRLDDFYRSGGDPLLPRIPDGPNAGLVDWDHPGSWLLDEAVAALRELCETGRAEVPTYDIAHDGRTGHRACADLQVIDRVPNFRLDKAHLLLGEVRALFG